MARMTTEERKRKERDRARRKRGWFDEEIPITAERRLYPNGNGRLFNALLPLPGAESGPAVDTRLTPPERKPRRKSEPKPKPDPDAQPTMDFYGE
jgi:hypothetical protein